MQSTLTTAPPTTTTSNCHPAISRRQSTLIVASTPRAVENLDHAMLNPVLDESPALNMPSYAGDSLTWEDPRSPFRCVWNVVALTGTCLQVASAPMMIAVAPNDTITVFFWAPFLYDFFFLVDTILLSRRFFSLNEGTVVKDQETLTRQVGTVIFPPF